MYVNPVRQDVCKHCQFVCLQYCQCCKSLDFPSLLCLTHVHYSISTCSVKGIPSLVCLHMLNVGAPVISMRGKDWQTVWQRQKIFGKDEEK